MANQENEALDSVMAAPEGDEEMQDVLHDLFEGLAFARFDEESCELSTDDFQDQLAALAGCRVRTFREAGLMTGNRGLIVTTRNGQEFQLTIVS
ncbi:MAG TPA: hypothetical protein VIE65_04215 [Methylobacter sp.]|jgi:hypothetical protein